MGARKGDVKSAGREKMEKAWREKERGRGGEQRRINKGKSREQKAKHTGSEADLLRSVFLLFFSPHHLPDRWSVYGRFYENKCTYYDCKDDFLSFGLRKTKDINLRFRIDGELSINC